MTDEYNNQKEQKRDEILFLNEDGLDYNPANITSPYKGKLGGSRQAHGETNSKIDKKFSHSMAYHGVPNNRMHKASTHSSFRR